MTRPRQTSAAGLSPRVRGNLSRTRSSLMPLRSIPACAGEPGITVTVCLLCGVYPRVCGGTMPKLADLYPCHGLSPRVRGNPAGLLAAILRWRSIPACAGEPQRYAGGRQPQQVYPRVCGGTGG